MKLVRASSVVASVIAASALWGYAGNAVAATGQTINCSGSPALSSLVDFDGDGIADTAVLLPGAADGHGAIEIRDSQTQTLTPGDGLIPSTTDDALVPGVTFAVVNINNDNCSDLAVGLPAHAVDGLAGVGAVQILFGSKEGFVAGPLLTPDSNGIPGSAQADENFGAALWGDGSSRLVIGVPGWTSTIVGVRTAHVGEALVTRLYNYSDDPTAVSVYTYPPLRMSSSLADNRLGTTVGNGVAGAPHASSNGHANAGCFVWNQLTYCGGKAGDQLGSSFAQIAPNILAVGAPGHGVAVTVGSHGHAHRRFVKQAGAVLEFAMAGTSSQPKILRTHLITQATSGVPGAPGRGNHFGYALSGVLNTVTGQPNPLAVGIPGMTVNGVAHAGAVAVCEGISPTSHWQLISRATRGVSGGAHAADVFGRSVAVTSEGYPGTKTDFLVLVGVPGESVDGNASAGRVQIFVTRGAQVTVAGSQLLTADAGPQAGARYGALVA